MESGIVPEKLPPEEDIKKLEKRVKDDEKKIATTSAHKRKQKYELPRQINSGKFTDFSTIGSLRAAF